MTDGGWEGFSGEGQHQASLSDFQVSKDSQEVPTTFSCLHVIFDINLCQGGKMEVQGGPA